MNDPARPEIPEEKIIRVNNSKKIDFDKPFKFIYFDWWYEILVIVPFLTCYIMVIFCALFFGFRVKGRKNMRILRRQGCISISNHCHYFDTVLANFVVLPRHLYTAVAQRNFEVPYVRRILRILRSFPIPANGRGLEMITEPVGEALRRGHHIHFLPEGDLVHLGQTIHRFRPGAFILSYRHQAPILPMVYVIKRRKFWGKPMRPNWVKITLVVGKPIFPPKPFKGNSLPKDELAQMSNRAATWMEKTIAEYHQEKPA